MMEVEVLVVQQLDALKLNLRDENNIFDIFFKLVPVTFGCKTSLFINVIELSSSFKSAVNNEIGFPILCVAISKTVN